ncbi:response regulator [Cesiribacter sp. SM1]|uniref:response regulator n=1 Tax=Cesiribacter sp. SM1 TaxID=2861196 RepID=UPI001CD2EEF4|nr:response regulator [Cesiribacter sp. SM1]
MKAKLEKILLVDDDPISNFVTEELIKEKGFCQTIVTVTDGQQALNFLEQDINETPSAYDGSCILVLLDLNMPVMDGFEFMEELEARQLHEKVKVAVLTSSDNHKDISHAQQLGFTAYLQKPLVVEEVRALVAECFTA